MKQEVLIGQTDFTVLVKIRDDAGAPATGLTEADVDIAYARVETDNDVTTADVTPAALASLTAAHADWGFEEVSATDHPGLYRLDLADAVFASGAWSAVVTVTGTGLDPADLEFVLVAHSPWSAVADILTDTGTTLQGELDGIQADTEDIQARLPAALVSGRIDASVGAMAANVMTAAAAAADLTTELQTGLATAAALDAVDNFVDTELAAVKTVVDAIQAVTDGLTLARGTIGATGNDTTHVHLSGLAYADDGLNSCLLVLKDVSTGLFYARWIEDFANAGDLATVATLPITPEASVDLYWVLPIRADVTGGSGLDAAGVRAAVGLASANLDTQLGDLPTNAELATALGTADDAILAILGTPAGASLAADIAAIEAQTDDIGAAGAGLTAVPWNAAWDAEVQSEATDALNAYDPPTKAELDSAVAPLATATALDTVDNLIDTEVAAIKTVVDAIQAKTDNLPSDPADASVVAGLIAATEAKVDTVDTVVDAIKAKTDSLTFTSAGFVDANVQKINDVTVVGDGSGTPWGV